ncbi:hypothetical protein EXIGLDRAFT_822691, partial [Exidia glandulosa HHB12029]
TIRKRNPYNTTSTRGRVVGTPGDKLVYHHIKPALADAQGRRRRCRSSCYPG